MTDLALIYKLLYIFILRIASVSKGRRSHNLKDFVYKISWKLLAFKFLRLTKIMSCLQIIMSGQNFWYDIHFFNFIKFFTGLVRLITSYVGRVITLLLYIFSLRTHFVKLLTSLVILKNLVLYPKL